MCTKPIADDVSKERFSSEMRDMLYKLHPQTTLVAEDQDQTKTTDQHQMIKSGQNLDRTPTKTRPEWVSGFTLARSCRFYADSVRILSKIGLADMPERAHKEFDKNQNKLDKPAQFLHKKDCYPVLATQKIQTEPERTSADPEKNPARNLTAERSIRWRQLDSLSLCLIVQWWLKVVCSVQVRCGTRAASKFVRDS